MSVDTLPKTILTVSLILFLCVPPVFAEQLFGKVISVADGDTITVLVDRTQIKVRLAEIDAPEKRQPFGTRAKQAMSELVFGKTVGLLSLIAIGMEERLGRYLPILEILMKKWCSLVTPGCTEKREKSKTFPT